MSETSGADTVDPAATDRRGLKVLGFDECLQRLRDAVVGRVGFLRDGEIAVLPVNHVVDGMDIAFRTSWGSKLQIAADAGRVAFEVDGHDPALSTGWSVLVHGTATLVYEDEDRERLDAIADKPWIPLDINTFWVRIRPEEITGREVRPRRRPPEPPAAANPQPRVSTTFSAPVSPGRENTSYACMTSCRGNRWVTNRLTSTCPLVTSVSSVGVE